MLVRINEKNKSILGFANYIALRHQNNEPISPAERLDLYGLYVTYCEMNNINYFHKLTFFKTIKEYGFTSEPVWDKTKTRTRNAYYMSDDAIANILSYVKGMDVVKSVSFIALNGQQWKMTTILEPLTMVKNNSHSDPTEEVNK